jgi:putative hydrolase of the HAD superfamily
VLDTETPIYEAWRAAYRSHGHELTLDDWQHALGTHGGFEPLAHLAARVGPGLDREATLLRVRSESARGCDAQALLPGVSRLLDTARARGLRRAVASSSTRAWVSGWLERHGVGGLVEVVCGREDVERVKPAPDLFVLAARRLGVDPCRCVAFEDSPNGLRAARAAGMRVVAVPNVLTARLALPEHDLRLDSLAERPLDEILALLADGSPPARAS